MGRKADGLGAAFRASEGKVCAGMARRGGERTDGGPAHVLRGPVAWWAGFLRMGGRGGQACMRGGRLGASGERAEAL